MRIILKLISKKTINQKEFNNKYNTSFHGFLFKKINDYYANKYGSFSFGNLFPIKNNIIKEGEKYNIIISSPKNELIEKLFFSINESSTINIGEGSFEIESIMIKNVILKKNSKIENIQPINITKQENNKIIAIKYEEEGFLELLKKNLIKKYNFFFPEEKIDEDFNLFENVIIKPYEKKKEASFPIYFYNKEKNDKFDVIGSKLIFKFNNISEDQLKVFQCCFDAGFGERTSYGAGFMIERWNKK